MALAGKRLVFTGTLAMQRSEASRLAQEAGATVQGGVNMSTDIVVAGPDAANTGKCIAAKRSGKTLWTEADFTKALSRKTRAKGGDAPVSSAAPLKRPAAAAAEDVAPAKRAKTDAAPSGAQPFKGMQVYRSGSHTYQKAVGELIVSLGGTWTKNPNQAAFCLDGIEVMRAPAKPYIKSIEGNKPIVCVPLDFTKGKPTADDTKCLLNALKAARALLPKIRVEGITFEAISAMYAKDFKRWWPNYHCEEYLNGIEKQLAEAKRSKTGFVRVLVNKGGKLVFESRERGK